MATARNAFLRRPYFSAYDPTVLTVPTDDVSVPGTDGSVAGSVSTGTPDAPADTGNVTKYAMYLAAAGLAYVAYKQLK